MKNIFLLITIILVAFGFNSCSDTEGVSTITTYATITLEEGAEIFWNVGDTWVEPGYTAKEGELDISNKVVISGNVKVNEVGNYVLKYSAVNSDGFAASASRLIHVCDMNAPLTGIYDSNIVRHYNGADAKRGAYPIVVMGLGDDLYLVEDLLGGWYKYGSGYGSAYASESIIEIQSDNTIEIIESAPLAWGYPCVFYDVSSYDPATGDILLKSIMEDTPGMLFEVTLSNKH